jgi:hypothetical protein
MSNSVPMNSARYLFMRSPQKFEATDVYIRLTFEATDL